VYKTIILDCQNKTDMISCEDCLVYHDCLARKEKENGKAKSKTQSGSPQKELRQIVC
jgi:hypothetical protein